MTVGDRLVQLNTLESAAMRTRQVVLPVNMDQTIPMHTFADEPMIQSAVLKLLDFLSTPSSFGPATLANQRQDKLRTGLTLTTAAAGSLNLRRVQPHDAKGPKIRMKLCAVAIAAQQTMCNCPRKCPPSSRLGPSAPRNAG